MVEVYLHACQDLYHLEWGDRQTDRQTEGLNQFIKVGRTDRQTEGLNTLIQGGGTDGQAKPSSAGPACVEKQGVGGEGEACY